MTPAEEQFSTFLGAYAGKMYGVQTVNMSLREPRATIRFADGRTVLVRFSEIQEDEELDREL